jgi:exonuclease SbcD
MVTALCAGFGADTVNLDVAHSMVRGGKLGGGERDAHTIEEYWIDPTVFPGAAHYVALGHLHRTQEMGGAAPIRYSGSPIQVDFGEERDRKGVLVVDAKPGSPAVVREVALSSPRRLRTVTGTVEQLRSEAGGSNDELLRVIVDEPGRAGLADEVRTLLPNAIDVRLARPQHAESAPVIERAGRSPQELFGAYLAEREIEDPRLTALFSRLLDEESEAV